MAIVDKDTLKGYFNDGDVPNEANYIDLIDSLAQLDPTVVVSGGNASKTTSTSDVNARLPSGFYNGDAVTGAPATSWHYYLNTAHVNLTNYYAMQLAGSFFEDKHYLRRITNGAIGTWRRILTSAEYHINIPLESWKLTGGAVIGELNYAPIIQLPNSGVPILDTTISGMDHWAASNFTLNTFWLGSTSGGNVMLVGSTKVYNHGSTPSAPTGSFIYATPNTSTVVKNSTAISLSTLGSNGAFALRVYRESANVNDTYTGTAYLLASYLSHD